jgi:hypothetical protein
MAIHMKPSLLQPLSIPGWKWEEIVMDFIVGLPTMEKGFDLIWVIVDHVTKLSWIMWLNLYDGVMFLSFLHGWVLWEFS